MYKEDISSSSNSDALDYFHCVLFYADSVR